MRKRSGSWASCVPLTWAVVFLLDKDLRHICEKARTKCVPCSNHLSCAWPGVARGIRRAPAPAGSRGSEEPEGSQQNLAEDWFGAASKFLFQEPSKDTFYRKSCFMTCLEAPCRRKSPITPHNEEYRSALYTLVQCYMRNFLSMWKIARKRPMTSGCFGLKELVQDIDMIVYK